MRRYSSKPASRKVGKWSATIFLGVASLTALPTYRLSAQDTAVTGAPQLRAAEPTIGLSQNPLRTGTVTFLWTPAGTGPAQVAVYSVVGTPVATATMLPDPGRYVWDGTGQGHNVVNGAYLVVVTRGDGKRLRRRLIVAR